MQIQLPQICCPSLISVLPRYIMWLLNMLVATVSMTSCEMKPVKPAARDMARQKLQPGRECLCEALRASKTHIIKLF